METIYQNIQKITHRIKFFGVAFLVIISLLIVSFMYHNYQKELNLSEKAVLNQLNAIVQTASLQLSVTDHSYLIDQYQKKDAITSNTQDATYLKVHQTLKKIANINQLNTTIYTLFKEENTNDHFHYLVSSTNPFFRHPYQTPPQLLLNDFEEGGMIPCYQDENGTWLSAFQPVKDETGKVVFVIQADEKFDTFISQARQEALKHLILWLLLWSFIAGLIFWLLQQLLKSIKNQLSVEKINKNLEEKISHRTYELVKTNQQLEASNEKLKVFASVVSHDLKAPLRAMNNFAKLLKKRESQQLSESGHEYVDFITDSSKRMTQLVEDLLNYAKINGRNPQFNPILLSSIIEDVLQNLQLDIQQNKADIHLNIPPNIYLKGDKTLLTQLFQNLLNNALKFQSDQTPIIHINLKDNNQEMAEIQVQDNGIGIPQEDFERIFDMFTRLQSTSTFKGSGIGLNTCKKIVDAHKGQIWLDSTVGQGTTFYLLLPKATISTTSADLTVSATEKIA